MRWFSIDAVWLCVLLTIGQVWKLPHWISKPQWGIPICFCKVCTADMSEPEARQAWLNKCDSHGSDSLMNHLFVPGSKLRIICIYWRGWSSTQFRRGFVKPFVGFAGSCIFVLHCTPTTICVSRESFEQCCWRYFHLIKKIARRETGIHSLSVFSDWYLRWLWTCWILLVNLLDLVGAFESIDCQFNRTAEFLRKFLWPFPLEAEGGKPVDLRRSDMGFVNVHLRLGGGYAYLRLAGCLQWLIRCGAVCPMEHF